MLANPFCVDDELLDLFFTINIVNVPEIIVRCCYFLVDLSAGVIVNVLLSSMGFRAERSIGFSHLLMVAGIQLVCWHLF